jgi:hypothetical protein
MAQDVSVSLMLDKDLYAYTPTYGYTSAIFSDKYKKNYKAGDFIGHIYSYLTRNNQIYLIVYASTRDYNNHNAIYVPIFENNLKIIGLKEAINAENAKKQAELDALKKEQVGATQFYIEKYGPWVLGAIVFIGVFPSIFKSVFKNEK